MIYLLRASGQTTGALHKDPVWGAGLTDGATQAFIQNRSGSDIEVVIAIPDQGGVVQPDEIILLPGSPTEKGKDTNHTIVDLSLAVYVRSQAPGCAYTALRIA